MVLFGGAKSSNKLFNDAILFNIREKKWEKLNSK